MTTMRHYAKLFIWALMALGLASCSFFDVEFDTEFEGYMPVDVQLPAVKSTADGPYPFQASATIDVLDDEDVYEYQDKIDDFIVSGVTATVDWVSEEGVEFLPQTSFTITNGKRTATWTLETAMPIKQGTSVNLENLGDIYATVNAILADMQPFTVSATGSCNKAPVSASIILGIKTKVVANPLNN
jgi:hypothetical protein